MSNLSRNNCETEIDCKIRLDWAAPVWILQSIFHKLHRFYASPLPKSLKTKYYNRCILPVMTYDTETWTVGLVPLKLERIWKELWCLESL